MPIDPNINQKDSKRLIELIYQQISPHTAQLYENIKAALQQEALHFNTKKKKVNPNKFNNVAESFLAALAGLEKSWLKKSLSTILTKYRELINDQLDISIPFDVYLTIINKIKTIIEQHCLEQLAKKHHVEITRFIDHMWITASIDIMRNYLELAEDVIEEKNAESALLFHTTKSIAIDLNLESLMNKVVFHGSMLLKSKSMFLFVPDESRAASHNEQRLVLKASNQLGETYGEYSLQYGEDIIGKADQQCRPVLDNEYQQQKRKIVFLQNAACIMAVPIIFSEELLGVLVAANKTTAFSEVDLELLTMYAQQIAVVFKNVLLYHQQSKNANELETKNRMLEAQSDLILKKTSQLVLLNELAQNINSSLELNEVLELVARQCAESIGVNQCLVWMVNEDDGLLQASAAHGLSKNELENLHLYFSELNQSLMLDVLHQKQIKLIPSAQEQILFKTVVKKQLSSSTSLLIPLILKEQALGVILVSDTRENHEFVEDEIALLTAIINQTVMAIENAKLYQKMKEQAITDCMTGLFNHRYFQLRLTEEYSHTIRHSIPLSLIMLDIDYFKKYNDTYGHMAGDLVLKEIAGLIKSTVRQNDVVARYGGEEFVVIMPLTNYTGAEVVAERIRASVEECLFLGDINTPQVSMSVSIGVAVIDPANKSLCSREALIKHADAALYQAKEGGRNRVIMATMNSIHDEK